MFGIFRKIFGTVNDRVIKSYQAEILHINSLEEEIMKLTDSQLQSKTIEFKQKLANGATLDDIVFQAFAVGREASKRVSQKRHFDEQLALTCDHKAEYWLDPEKYDEKEVEDIDISLNSVRDAYRAQLSGNISKARRGV